MPLSGPVLDFVAFFAGVVGAFCFNSLALGSVFRLPFKPHRSESCDSAMSFPKIGYYRPTDR
jgi:hypothetical protein